MSARCLENILPNLVSLTSLNLSNAGDRIGVSACELIANLSHLTHLNLSRCDISSQGIAVIGGSCPKLKSLDLSYCLQINDDGFQSILSENLETLKLKQCRMTNTPIIYFATTFIRLRLLDIRGCILLSDINALSKLPLQTLLLEDCAHISDMSLSAISSFTHLKELNIHKCRHISDVTIQKVCEGCPFLRVLILGNNKIDTSSQGALANFKQQRPQVIIKDLTPTLEKKHSTPAPRYEINSIRCLQRDLKQICANPLENISALPLESDMYVWHANLFGADSTLYAGGVFHLQLSFPKSYPSDSPSATLFTELPHPHVIKNKICLDILSDFDSFFVSSTPNEKSGVGWSSAYSVQTILLQLQSTFFVPNPAFFQSLFLSFFYIIILCCSSISFRVDRF